MEAAMSGKGFELDSNFLPNNKRVSGVDDDRISQLPDDIIVHILSFLPLKKATGTSVLSRRWSHLWKYTPNLNFVNDSLVDPMINIPVSLPKTPLRMPKSDRWIVVRSLKNIAWINSVLDSYKALSLKQLEISFHLHTDSYSQLLTKWLHFAFSRRVESLKLYLASAPYILDANILRSSMERSSGCRLFLKELRLERLSVSGEAIEWFLHNCPLLEVLIIDATLRTSDLVVVGGTLKHLELYSSDFEISFRVSAPNLTRLEYSFDLEKLFLKNVSNLVEASFGLCGSLDAMRHLTNAAPRLETLTLTLSCPSELPVPQMLKLNKLVKLVLDYETMNENYLLPVTCFLHASPCLQELRLKINERFYHNDFLFEGGTFDGGIFEVPKVGGSPHHHLNVFEFSGFCYDAADHMELVSYIVDHCVALHEIIIIPIYPSYCLEREISPGVVLPSRFSANPYVVKYRLYDPTYDPNVFTPFTVDHDVIASARRDASLNIKKCTEQLLAPKVPHHIKLLVV